MEIIKPLLSKVKNSYVTEFHHQIQVNHKRINSNNRYFEKLKLLKYIRINSKIQTSKLK